MIQPHFEELSNTHSNIQFLEVDVNELENVAKSEQIRAMVSLWNEKIGVESCQEPVFYVAFSPRLCSTKTAKEQAENCKALVRKSWHFWSKLLRTCWELANHRHRHRLHLHLREDRHVRHDRPTRRRQILNSPMPSLRGNRAPEDAQFCRSLLQSSRAQMTKRSPQKQSNQLEFFIQTVMIILFSHYLFEPQQLTSNEHISSLNQ